MAMTTTAPVPRARRAVPPVRHLAPRRQGSPWVRRAVVFATCVLLADAIFGDRGLAQTLRARHEYAQAAAALASLRQENARLRERARRLQNDPAAIEAAARETLGLIRPGEILVVVKDLH